MTEHFILFASYPTSFFNSADSDCPFFNPFLRGWVLTTKKQTTIQQKKKEKKPRRSRTWVSQKNEKKSQKIFSNFFENFIGIKRFLTQNVNRGHNKATFFFKLFIIYKKVPKKSFFDFLGLIFLNPSPKSVAILNPRA